MSCEVTLEQRAAVAKQAWLDAYAQRQRHLWPSPIAQFWAGVMVAATAEKGRCRRALAAQARDDSANNDWCTA